MGVKDPVERLCATGFNFLNEEEMIRYLKAKGKFDRNTDIYRLRLNGQQPNFEKAKAQGEVDYAGYSQL